MLQHRHQHGRHPDHGIAAIGLEQFEHEARFERLSEPGNASAVSAAYTLQRAMSGLWLQERLAQVAAVSGCGLTTVAELVETLKINRGKRVTRDSTRG